MRKKIIFSLLVSIGFSIMTNIFIFGMCLKDYLTEIPPSTIIFIIWGVSTVLFLAVEVGYLYGYDTRTDEEKNK